MSNTASFLAVHAYIQLLSFFIDSNFVIIIYIPYTCMCVCYKHMLCLIYDLCLLLQEQLYLVIMSKMWIVFSDFFISIFNF